CKAAYPSTFIILSILQFEENGWIRWIYPNTVHDLCNQISPAHNCSRVIEHYSPNLVDLYHIHFKRLHVTLVVMSLSDVGRLLMGKLKHKMFTLDSFSPGEDTEE
uniref:Uncharacterized protein n=1 Tax=Parascaris equorum TaxID=6256 RepID=A0A914RNN6_PAREQ